MKTTITKRKLRTIFAAALLTLGVGIALTGVASAQEVTYRYVQGDGIIHIDRVRQQAGQTQTERFTYFSNDPFHTFRQTSPVSDTLIVIEDQFRPTQARRIDNPSGPSRNESLITIDPSSTSVYYNHFGIVDPDTPAIPANPVDPDAEAIDPNDPAQPANTAFDPTDFGQELEPDCEGTLDAENCGITKWLSILINTLTVIFGIIAVVMIAYGGIEYTISRDNPQMAAKAKERIRNVIIALVAYVFLYAFLQYVIPGGVL